jgi:hypothetical protein
MGKAQEVEGLRLANPPCRPIGRGIPAEFDQAGFIGVQFQGELRHPGAHCCQEPFGVGPVLKPNDSGDLIPRPESISIMQRQLRQRPRATARPRSRPGRRRGRSDSDGRVTAANILRIAIGLVITTSGQSPVRQDSGFYPDKSYARASGQANSNDIAAAARERQAPKSTRVGSPDFGWG